jgi:hypothetical protein
MSDMTLTLDGLLAKTPDILKPIVVKYGPALVEMTAQEFCDWLQMMLYDDDELAWGLLLTKMRNPALLDAWNTKAAEWDAANEKNAARVALQKEATLFTLKLLLGVALAGLGF